MNRFGQILQRFTQPLAMHPLILFCALAVLPMACIAAGDQSGSVHEVAQQAAEQAVKKTVSEAAQQAAEKAAQKTVEKVAEKAVEKVAGEAVKKAVEKAAADAAAQAEQTAKRPGEWWWGATKVYFLVFIVDIDAIDDADQNFTANIYLRLRWQDPRLAKPGAEMRQVPLESVWNPRVLLANRTGLISKSLPDVVQIDEEGMITYHQRYTGKLSQAMDLSDFPRDRHNFLVHFVAAGYGDDQLEFVPDTHPSNPSASGGGIADELSLPDWKILSHEALKLRYQPIAGAHAAGFAFRFQAERYVDYYVWQVVLPLAVVVMMSWSAFWLGRRETGVRIGVATSSVLTMIAHRFVLASLLPRLPYMTRMDYLTAGSTLLVLLALLMVTLIVVLENNNRQRLAQQFDLWARAGFPMGFFLLWGWFQFG